MAIDPITAALDIGSKIIERIWPNPSEAAAAKLELLKMQQSGELAQITAQTEINKVEAANTNMFVSGWRPAVGWVCALGLSMQFLIAPIATWGVSLLGYSVVFPQLDMGTLLTLLGGMLGLGGLRTVEKMNGVASK